MFTITDMNDSQMDFFKELENIGAGHATSALADMLGHRVDMSVPTIKFCQIEHITDILKGPENLVTGMLVAMSGDLSGFILLVLDAYDAHRMAQLIMGMPRGEAGPPCTWFDEMEVSALSEMANILVGAYITAISYLTEFTIVPSVPELVIDMAGAVMNVPAIAYSELGDVVLFMETKFIDEDETVSGHFFLMPDVASLKLLMNKMGIA